MTDYKNQHWLPSGYMKYFAASGVTKGRKTSIYYTNKNGSNRKKVDKLSCDDFHYSEERAETVETSFHSMENDYPVLVKKILNDERLTKKEYYSMIITMIEYHARNPSYENLTKEENYEAYLTVSRGLFMDILEGCEGCHANLQKGMDFIASNWLLQPLTSSKEELFSSDHPSLLFSIDKKLSFIILPINPHHALLAVDKRKVKIVSNTINENDNGLLNALQVNRCIEFIYSNIDLSDKLGEGTVLTRSFEKKRTTGFVRNDSWLPEYINYPDVMPNKFSFIKKKD